jgi:hypothetical protein
MPCLLTKTQLTERNQRRARRREREREKERKRERRPSYIMGRCSDF